MQGREREAVVLSLVRSNPKHEVGFLSDDRRLNVALTRARRHLCVVADSDTVSSHPFLAKLVKYCEENAEYNGADLYLPADRPIYGVFATESRGGGGGAATATPAATAKTGPKKTKKKAAAVTTTTTSGGASAPASPAAQQQAKASKSTEEEAVDTGAYEAIKAQVVAFLASSEPAELVFPASLTSYERYLLHRSIVLSISLYLSLSLS